MQLVVVMAVRKAVSAATITFTAISTMRFFMRHLLPYSASPPSSLPPPPLTVPVLITSVLACAGMAKLPV